MAVAHVAFTVLTGVAGVSLLLAAGSALVGARYRRTLVDRLILVILAFVMLAILTGALLVLGGRAPSDGLHPVYAAASLLALPIARSVAHDRPARRAGAIVALGALILLALLLRLAMTA